MPPVPRQASPAISHANTRLPEEEEPAPSSRSSRRGSSPSRSLVDAAVKGTPCERLDGSTYRSLLTSRSPVRADSTFHQQLPSPPQRSVSFPAGPPFPTHVGDTPRHAKGPRRERRPSRHVPTHVQDARVEAARRDRAQARGQGESSDERACKGVHTATQGRLGALRGAEVCGGEDEFGSARGSYSEQRYAPAERGDTEEAGWSDSSGSEIVGEESGEESDVLGSVGD